VESVARPRSVHGAFDQFVSRRDRDAAAVGLRGEDVTSAGIRAVETGRELSGAPLPGNRRPEHVLESANCKKTSIY